MLNKEFYYFLRMFVHSVFEITILWLWPTVHICDTTDVVHPSLAERIRVPTPRRGLGLLKLAFPLFNYFTFLYTWATRQTGLITLYTHFLLLTVRAV